MGQMLTILMMYSFFVQTLLGDGSVSYDNLNSSASRGLNCSEILDKLVKNVDYDVEDFTDYSQDKEEPKYAPDVAKSRKPRGIKRVLSWVGRGFGKVFNSPYIYNFYPIINYSVGKIMQHLPFLSNSPSNPPQCQSSPDYPQSPSPPNPQQLQKQQQMQQEYEEEMEKKQREMEQKQEEEEARAKHAAEEKKQINERAKKLAAKYVELYFAKQAQSSPVTGFKEMAPNFAAGSYNVPVQAPVYNAPVYDQAYPQANYPAVYPPVDNIAGPESIPAAVPDAIPAAVPDAIPPVPDVPVYNPAPPPPPPVISPVAAPVNYVNV